MELDTEVQAGARQPQAQVLPEDISFLREQFPDQFTKPPDGEEGKRQLQQMAEALATRKKGKDGAGIPAGLLALQAARKVVCWRSLPAAPPHGRHVSETHLRKDGIPDAMASARKEGFNAIFTAALQ
eukprot:662040-Lingulodinium_polyedra.AAC.1